MWLLRRVGGLCCTADLYRDEADVWYSSRIQLEIDYAPGEKLGEGSYAVVRAVRRRRDGARLAATRISKRLTLSDANVLWAAPAEPTFTGPGAALRRLLRAPPAALQIKLLKPI